MWSVDCNEHTFHHTCVLNNLDLPIMHKRRLTACKYVRAYTYMLHTPFQELKKTLFSSNFVV